MDFNFSEEQAALRDLAREILEKETTPDRLKQAETAGEFFDRDLWVRLAQANLLGLAVPEAQGGMGMGLLELCLLLQEVGRSVAPVPVLPALVAGGLSIARFGNDAQRDRWLAPLAKGESVLTAALDFGVAVTARRDEDGASWVVDGVCPQVPAAHLAARVLVPARGQEGELVLLVDPSAEGVEAVRRRSSRYEPVSELTLSGVVVPDDDVLAGEGGEGALAWMRERALVGIAATQLGVSERSLEITTKYLGERQQFGAPLGALSAVQHRCADCYIALDSLRWVTWMAAWKLAEERPAERDAWIAKFWAADAGSKIATATQHLHGGMGVDLDYPIHRYFLWSKALELALGGATPQLVRLGRDMARRGPQEFL